MKNKQHGVLHIVIMLEKRLTHICNSKLSIGLTVTVITYYDTLNFASWVLFIRGEEWNVQLEGLNMKLNEYCWTWNASNESKRIFMLDLIKSMIMIKDDG